MSKLINTVVKIGTFGLVDDATGVEAGEQAAINAGNIQAQAAQAGVDEQRRQFDITQESFEPFRGAGVDAIEQQRILLGLGASPQTDPNAGQRENLLAELAAIDSNSGQFPLQAGGGGAISLALGRVAGREAGNQANDRAGIQAKLDALPAFNAAEMPSAEAQQQAAFEKLDSSPGQQFLRDRAQKNLLRNASSIGGLGGGNVRSALVQQGVGFAQQDLQNQFGRLGQLSGQGQQATSRVGQFGQQTSQGIQQGLNQQAQARASGLLGAQQANAQFNQGLLGAGATLGGALLASDIKLKDNLIRVGEANGFNWYTWTWNKLAESIGLTGNSDGVIANEVQIKKPHLVIEQDGYLAVNYEGLGV